jgi:hypothetical protein
VDEEPGKDEFKYVAKGGPGRRFRRWGFASQDNSLTAVCRDTDSRPMLDLAPMLDKTRPGRIPLAKKAANGLEAR